MLPVSPTTHGETGRHSARDKIKPGHGFEDGKDYYVQ